MQAASLDGLYIGLISGTSVDGIDAALVHLGSGSPRMLSGLTYPWPEELRRRILDVAQGQRAIDLDEYGRLDVAVGQQFAAAASALLAQSGLTADEVLAIGSHGQTVRHRPSGEQAFSLQIGDPSVIAERCGIDVVADFRRADVAAGGQGAPLLPALHAMLLSSNDTDRIVLNLGGIANITALSRHGNVLGFDTGPANGLLDAWCQRHRNKPFDEGGEFAASGQIDNALLTDLLADAYFALAAPKSTGREHFHLDWLDAHARVAAIAPADVQATLLELSVISIAEAIEKTAPAATEIWVCGGGVHNARLLARLSERLAPRHVQSTAELGVDPDFLEAAAFAWLARQRLLGMPGNLPTVTGARGPRLLGAIYAKPGRTKI